MIFIYKYNTKNMWKNIEMNLSYFSESFEEYMNEEYYQLLLYKLCGISFFAITLNSLWNNMTYFNQVVRDVDIINKELFVLKNKCELLETKNV